MAENKYKAPPKPYKPASYTLQYANANNSLETIQGSAKQVILHILNQQTVK